MTTSALIKTPWNNTYFISADGYPSEVGPYLQNLIEDAKNRAKQEYNNPEGKWIRELKLEMNEQSEEQYSGIQKTNQVGMTNYTYRIKKDGTIEFIGEGSQDNEWKEYEP